VQIITNSSHTATYIKGTKTQLAVHNQRIEGKKFGKFQQTNTRKAK
jgi:hypothetical protein